MMSGKRGFTLLEVMVAVAILTIIIVPLTSIMPNFARSNKNYKNIRLLINSKDSFHAELTRILYYDYDWWVSINASGGYPSSIDSKWDQFLDNTLDSGVACNLTVSPRTLSNWWWTYEIASYDIDYVFFIDDDNDKNLDSGELSISGSWNITRPGKTMIVGLFK